MVGTEGCLLPKKIKIRHFEKFIDCMVLKLAVYQILLEMPFPSFLSQKPDEILIFRNALSEISNFGLYFH